jgi:hypothetical protein
MSGKSKKRRAKRAARAAAAAQQAQQKAEQLRIRTEMEALQRGMGEELAGRRRARGRGGVGLLGTAVAGMTGSDEETLG